MPDFNKILADLQKNQKAIEMGSDMNPDVVEELNKGTDVERLRKQAQYQKQTDPLSFADPSAANYLDSQESEDAFTSDIENQMHLGGMEKVGLNQDAVEGTWSNELVHEDFIDKFSTSVGYGLGESIGRFGDIFQVLGTKFGITKGYEDNLISSFLQEAGEDIKKQYVTHIPEEVLNPDFSFKTYMNPNFWAVHGGRHVPQLIEVLAIMATTKGIGAGVNTAAKKGLGKFTQQQLKNAGVRGTTKAVYKGAKGTVEFGKGRGLMGRIFTDQGLTKGFREVLDSAVGGGLMNLQVSLANAGEMYNTFKEFTDDEGNQLFSDEELAHMASATFSNNMQYLLADMMSFGLTFGNLGKALSGGFSKLGKGKATNEILKTSSALFSKSMAPLIKKANSRAAKLGFKAVREGIEETFQESFEEWAKMKAYKDHTGSLDGYPGATSDHDTFLDYYFSKDAEGIKAVSFGLGALTGGLFNLNTLINKEADDAAKSFIRTENLKNIYEAGTLGHKNKMAFMQEQMAEIVFDGKEEFFADWIKDEFDENRISEEELQFFTELFDEMSATKNEISGLSIKGKKALMRNISSKTYFQREIDSRIEKTKENIEAIKRSSTDPEVIEKAINEQNEILVQQLAPLVQMTEIAQENINNLLKNKPATPIEYDIKVDEYGNEYFIYKNDKEGKKYEKEKDEVKTGEEAEKEATKIPKKKFSEQIRDSLKKVMNTFFSETNQSIDSEDQNQGEPIALANKNTEVMSEEDIQLEKDYQEELRTLDYDQDKNVFTTSKRTLPKELVTTEDAIAYINDDYNERREENKERREEKKIIDDEAQKSKDPDKDSNQDTKEGTDQDAKKDSGQETEKDTKKDTKKDSKKDSDSDKKIDDITDQEQDYADEAINREHDDDTITIEEEEEAEKQKLLGTGDTNKETSLVVSEETDKEIMSHFTDDADPDTDMDDDTDTDDDTDVDDDGEGPITIEVKPEDEKVSKSKKTIGILNRVMDFLSKTKNKLKNSKKKIDRVFSDQDTNELDFESVATMMSISARLRSMFPDQDVSAYKISQLRDIYGNEVFGFTLAGAIYVDSNQWAQGNTLMHEGSHVYFDVAGGFDNEEVMSIIKVGMENKELIDFLTNHYDRFIMYKTAKGHEITKQQIFTIYNEEVGGYVNEYDARSKEEREDVIERLIKEGYLEEIPMERQPIIGEEIFAFTMQKELSKRYDSLFNPKWTPEQNKKRERAGIKFWNMIKKAATRDKEYNEEDYLKNISKEQKEEFESAKEFIFKNIDKGVKGKNVTGRVKYELSRKDDAKFIKTLNDIEEKISKNIDENINKEFKVPSKFEDLSSLFDYMEAGEYSPFYEMDRLQYIQKANKVVNRFVEVYNKVLQKRFEIENKGNPVRFAPLKYRSFGLDPEVLTVKLWSMINNTETSTEFINDIENSSIKEIKEFNQYLEKVREDKYMFLNTYWFLKKNEVELNSLKTVVTSNGKLMVLNNLNLEEEAKYQSAYVMAKKSISHYFTSKAKKPKYDPNPDLVKRYSKVINSMNNIRSGKYTNGDLYNVLEFFSAPGIKITELIKNNHINIDGKILPLRQTIISLVKSERGLKDNSLFVLDSNGRMTGQMKPAVRKFMKGIVATNRKYTGGKMILNAESNPENTRTVPGFLVREFDNMNKDALNMTYSDFFKKYAHISKNFKEGSQSNQILHQIWNGAQANTPSSLSFFHGIENYKQKGNRVIKSTSDIEASLNEFLMFIDSAYVSGKNSETYLMEVNRLSDSPRSYVFNAPKIDIMKMGSFDKDGNYKFTKKNAAFKNAYQLFNKLSDQKITIDEFAEMIEKQIEKEIEFTNENIPALLRVDKTAKYIKNGKITPAMKKMVADYTINQFLNGMYFHEIFLPSFTLYADRDKRSKYLSSPGFSIPGIKSEIIPYYDKVSISKEGEVFEETDGAMYILRKHAERLERAGGNAFKLNKAYKILNTGVEKENPLFAGKSMYDKGYTTILDEEYVKKNPHLRGLYNLMLKRDRDYEKKHGKIGKDDLLTGKSNYIQIAVPISANKSNNYPEPMVENVDGVKSPSKTGALFDLENLNNAKNLSAQTRKLNKWYYDKQKDFIGLSGDNFMIQQVMDIPKTESGVSVQMTRFLLSQSAVNGTLKDVESLQRLLTEAQRERIAEYERIINEGSQEELRKVVYELINKELADPRQVYYIQQKLSLNTPDLRILAKNTLSNYLRKKGNKLDAPGTIATQKPATWEKQYVTNGSKSLSYYQKGDKTIPMEVVVPKNLETDNGLKARVYYTLDKLSTKTKQPRSVKLKSLKEQAQKRAAERGVGIGQVYNDNNELIGYYVQGDLVMLTRIPAHGLQSTGVGEVVDFDTTGASNIQTPKEFALKTTGGDFDGDFVFLQHKDKFKTSKWNKFFDKTVDLLMDPNLYEEITLGMDVKEDAKPAIAKVESVYGKSTDADLPWSPGGRRQSHRNTLGAKSLIGMTANMHTLIGMLAAYNTQLSQTISINGVEKSAFTDFKTSSRTIGSAKAFNLILDNSKDQYADKLGINLYSAPVLMVLRNLGYDLGDIGIILNSKAAKEYFRLLKNKENVFNDPQYFSNIGNLIRKNLGIELKKSSDPIDIQISTDKSTINDHKNLSNIIDLFVYISEMNSQMQAISSVLSGHNQLENNPFLLQNQINSFENAVDNRKDNPLKIPSEFVTNPIVVNYRENLELNQKGQQIIDPAYRKDSIELFERLSKSLMRNLSKRDLQILHDDINTFYTARLLNYNQFSKEFLQELEGIGPNSVYSKLSNHIAHLQSIVLKTEDKGNLFERSITAMDNNLLLNNLILMNLSGEQRFISLNSDYYTNKLSEPQRQRALYEFSQLPSDLKNALIIHDLISTGWKGPNTLFPLFGQNFQEEVSLMSDIDASQKDTNLLSHREKVELENAFLQKNDGILKVVTVPPVINNVINEKLPISIRRNMYNGEPTAFKYIDKNQKPTIYYFRGIPEKEIGSIASLRKGDRERFLDKYLADKLEKLEIDNQNKNIPLIAIKSEETKPLYGVINDQGQIDVSDLDTFINSINNPAPITETRYMVDDFWNRTHFMSESEYESAMQYDSFVSDIQKEAAYHEYKEKRSKAEELAEEINSDTVKKMSDQKLKDLYLKYEEDNKFAYANILKPIMFELVNRMGMEQARIINEKHGVTLPKNDSDISPLKAYLMTNNVPSNHPETQAMVRTLEVEYKRYLKEKNKLVGEINKATDALYKEKFGFGSHGGSLTDRIKRFFMILFANKESLYNQLYGNLVETEIIRTKDREVKNFKYKSREVIEKMYQDKKLSQAEYDFYNVTRSITESFENKIIDENKKLRKDYIPHTKPSNLEILSRRGLLGLMLNSRNLDESVADVVLSFKNPDTGKMETARFGDISNIYNAIAAGNKKSLLQVKDYLLLKRRAIKLYEKGINEDGSPIQISNFTVDASVSGNMMNRFLHKRSKFAEDMPSLDLNKAFVDYVNTTLFVNGNENFKGMKNMLPLVDSILAFTDSKNQVNLNKYVKKVWKNYFLERKKQSTLPSTATQKALGLETDKVIDLLTKSSLFYWLGWKGLLLAGGGYAVGNLLIGKYNNIKTEGGKNWIKGEKRFWFGRSGRIDPLNPFKGVKEANKILRKIGFMDINVYDDVNVEAKSSFGKAMSDLALMPMIYSERWIQGVHFLGLLTDQEWDSLVNDDNSTLDIRRLTELENEVKNQHGKGYQATDQRMIQMYSMGRMFMQFGRYIPTMFYDRFSKEDLDIYGNKHMGSYTAFWKTIQRAATGEMNPAKFQAYRRGLDSAERKRLDSALMGFGLMAALGIIETFLPNEATRGIIKDANVVTDLDRLSFKTTPASVRMVSNVLPF